MRKHKVIKEVLGDEAVLSPSEVCNKEFKRSLAGGYATDEVNEFLEQVADVLESIIAQLITLKEENDRLTLQLDEYRTTETTLRNALVSSQKIGEEIIHAAKREARALLEEGRLERAKEAEEAPRIPEEIQREVRRLEEQRDRLRHELTAILETHRNLLERPDAAPEQGAQDDPAAGGEGTSC